MKCLKFTCLIVVLFGEDMEWNHIACQRCPYDAGMFAILHANIYILVIYAKSDFCKPSWLSCLKLI